MDFLNFSEVDSLSFAVIGDPIAHSLSPAIHMQFAAQCDVTMRYKKWRLAADEFDQEVRRFFSVGGAGLNVTMPHKGAAHRLCAQLSDRATHAGAVNTLYLKDNEIHGDNTDGFGLIADLERLGWSIAGQHMLMIGAGGAVRGVLQGLIEKAPKQITIINRTMSKAKELCFVFSDLAAAHNVRLDCQNLDLSANNFELVINATSAGLDGEAPALNPSLVEAARCYDMFYAAKPTPFLTWAAKAGARSVADGLGMLVGQAAESFFIWHGVRPEILPVLNELRASLMKQT